MRDEIVHKVSHCAWQIHYQVVFPVKDRRALLDEAVVRIMVETAAEISERYDIEFEQIGCDRDHLHPFVFSPPEGCSGSDCAGVQEHHGARDLSAQAECEEGVVGWRILDGRLLRGYGRRRRELGSDREVYAKPRQAEG